MTTRLMFIVVFIVGVSAGWLGQSWLGSGQANLVTSVSDGKDDGKEEVATRNIDLSSDFTPAVTQTAPSSNVNSSNRALTAAESKVEISLQEESPPEVSLSRTDVISYFTKLLNDRLYREAMTLYQEAAQTNNRTAFELKGHLMSHLDYLAEARNDSDFSELIDSYLSVYYDDIDVLLALAEFNQGNGYYLEAVDVYLLAKTYAYAANDQQKILDNFNQFVERTDGVYTNQKNWLSLINFYSHIDSSGLMTSPYQFRQALSYLRNGDESVAIEQFTQLINDNIVGEQASVALSELANNGETTASIGNSITDNTSEENSEQIALQQVGNQYVAGLTINRQDDIKLLIDTGASITALTRESFDSLVTYGDAVEQGRRSFRTANGVILGTVYSVPELTLGSYTMKDTQIAVLEFDMRPGIDGLLGMNVLGQYRFQIDQENNSLLLNRK